MSAIAVIARAAFPLVLVVAAACRPGEGQRCVCEGECRRGLVCAQGGRTLDENECVDPADPTPGECVRTEDENLSDMAVDEGVPTDFVYHDLGGKRDFEPGRPPDDGTTAASTTESGTSESTTTPTTGGDATTTGASSSSSSTSTGAGSSSTGAP